METEKIVVYTIKVEPRGFDLILQGLYRLNKLAEPDEDIVNKMVGEMEKNK